MKKLMLAVISAFGLVGGVSAQSSVSLYGIIDLGVSFGKGSLENKSQVSRGGYQSSRLGFRGVEDLGNGVTVGFNLESGFNADEGTGGATSTNNQDNGNAGNGGLTFNRASILSIKGSWGELRAGRDTVPQYNNFGLADPMLLVGAGAAVNYTNIITGPTNTRASNGLYYFTPKLLNTLVVHLAHYRGENVGGTAAKDDGTGSGIRIIYQDAKLTAGLGWGRTSYVAGDALQRNVAMAYELPWFKLSGMLNWDKRGDLAARGGLVGALVPVSSAGAVRMTYSVHKTNQPNEPKAQKLAVSYVHTLSKRTLIYTTLAHVKNSGGSKVALMGAVTEANRPSSGFDIGLRHSF